jgi:Site-specific recombinase XerD
MTGAVLSDLSVTFDPLLDKSYRETALGRDVADFLAWRRVKNAAPRTLDQYERDLSRGCLMFPKLALADWTVSELVHVADSFPDASRRVRMAAWQKFFKWALDWEKIDRDPCVKLGSFKREPQKTIDVFSEPEVARLCGLPLIDGALMQILFDAGLRREEAETLRLDQFRVEPAPGELDIRGKGRKERLIPVTLRLAQRLEELTVLEGLNAGDHFWYTRHGNAYGSHVRRRRPIGHTSWDRWWRDCLDRAGVRYRKPHTTRHTFATRYLRNGGSIDRLSRLMGHESIDTTDKAYSHLDTVDLAAEMHRVFAALEKGSAPHTPGSS